MKKNTIIFMTLFLLAFQSKTLSITPDNKAVNSSRFFNEESDWIVGADVSYLDQMEEFGAVYRDMGVKKDALLILKEHWFNTIRLRLWHTPSNDYCGFAHTAVMAERIKAAGLKFVLDIHYSDSWADIVQQPKPALWENLTFPVLKDSVYQYTRAIIQALKERNALPDIVQIGNEIAHGILWNDGRVGDAYHTSQQWKQFAELIQAGIKGVKESESPGESIRIMIHIHCGSNNGFSTWFYDNLIANGVDFDIIGLSFYTSWGNTWQELQENMNSLALRYKKDIIVAEIAYPWSLSNLDWFPNQVTASSQLQTGYDASVKGQKQYLKDLIDAVRNVPDNLGKGVIYYSPEYIPVPGVGSSWDNNTLFNAKGELLPSVDSFAPTGVERVTLRMNCSSIPDTLGCESFFQLRGSADGIAPAILPDGYVLDWTDNSDIKISNAEGDYYSTTFFVPSQTRLQFKFWSKDMEKLGTNGWEIGNTGTNSTGDMLLTVTQDTTLPVHFFNGLVDKKPYDWRPWEFVTDKVTVWFRVFMNTEDAVQKGYLSGTGNPIVGVRGDALDGNGPLDWGATKVILKHESENYNYTGYHLYSGAATYNKLLVGREQKYKFFIESNGWEKGSDRTFFVPDVDTTLHWVYFSNSKPADGLVKIRDERNEQLNMFSLFDNYPNPFNASTVLKFSIPYGTHVTLKLYDILGRESLTLANGNFLSGEHTFKLDASELPNGIYVYVMEADAFKKSKKLLVLK